MDEPFDPDDERRFGLGWYIGMALRRLPLYLGRRKLTLDDKIALGGQIARHLRRAGVIFTRNEPPPGHGARPDEPDDNVE